MILAKLTLVRFGRFKNQILFSLSSSLTVAVAWCSGSPSAAPSSAGEVGVFGHRLSEFRSKPRSVWLARASFDGRPLCRATQDKSGSWGALSFGYLFFVQAKKSNSPKRRKATFQQMISCEKSTCLDSGLRRNDERWATQNTQTIRKITLHIMR